MTTPTQFRKKPVTIEAMRFAGAESAQQIFDWFDEHDTQARYFEEQLETDEGEVVVSDAEHMTIATLEGTMRAAVGDWIIKGVQGEFYPCKPDIFAATYESAAEEDWEYAVARESDPSTGVYFLDDAAACERFIAHPPLGVDRATGYVAVRRRRASDWEPVS